MFRDVLMLTLGFGLVVGVGRERQRRAVLRARSREDLRDRFLATLSHELRTPLNAIIGWAQLLKMGGLEPSEVPRAIDAIDRNARAEARMVDDLLDVSRMRQGRLAIVRAPVDIARITEDVVNSLRPTVSEHGLELNAEIDRTSIRVLGDEVRLRQLVRHIIGNSLKFTPAGGQIHVRVTTDGSFAVLRFHDDGTGIARRHLPNVRDPFFQASPRPLRRGLGLGLTLVAELVELHGGTLDITSKGENAGTLVVVRLPLTRLSS